MSQTNIVYSLSDVIPDNKPDIEPDYFIFEPNQVLTEAQLNTNQEYINDQLRLSRVELSGIGVLAGLEPQWVNKTQLVINQGIAITSDGDLVRLASKQVFNRYKVYNQEQAPSYPPFHANNISLAYRDATSRSSRLINTDLISDRLPLLNENLDDRIRANASIKLFELVTVNATDQDAIPLAELENLSQYVVLAFVESYHQDHDLCSGSNCDNLGKTAVSQLRFLLVELRDAYGLLPQIDTWQQRAQYLSPLFADRPLFNSPSLSSPWELASLYRSSASSIFGNVMQALTSLQQQFSRLCLPFSQNSSGTHITVLLQQQHNQFLAAFNSHTLSHPLYFQQYYNFLCDLVNSYNQLQQILLADNSVLCPSPASFPKHLLLGQIGQPNELRTACYPSPHLDRQQQLPQQAKFLVQKLLSQVLSFLPLQGGPIRITPSASLDAPSEQQAIPAYYSINDAAIQEHWNFELQQNKRSQYNFGYAASAYSNINAIRFPLNYQLRSHHFFRIEGHIGHHINATISQLEAQIKQYNLPFTVRAVLLNNDRKKIIIKPRLPYSSLHRFHDILRKDLTLQLDKTKQFNDAFKQTLELGIKNGEVDEKQTQETVNNRYNEIKSAADNARKTLSSKNYYQYRSQRQSSDWRTDYKNMINSAGSAKSTLGNVIRTDYSTMFDKVVASHHPSWLDWLDLHIQQKDEQAEQKLLFPNFIKQHPAFDHLAGCCRGGTFVLLYNEAGLVIGDMSLPYFWLDEDEEVDDKEQNDFDFSLPNLVAGGLKINPNLLNLKDMEKRLNQQWVAQVDTFKERLGLFSTTLQSYQFPSVGGYTIGNITTGYQDGLLEVFMNDVLAKQKQVELLEQQLKDFTLDKNVREQANRLLNQTQQDLANSITRGTEYIAHYSSDKASAAETGKALNTLNSSANHLSTEQAKESLQQGLSSIQSSNTAINEPVKNFIGSWM